MQSTIITVEGLTMELTKIEQAVVVGTIISGLGPEIMQQLLDEETIIKLDAAFEAVTDNTTPKQIKESTKSAIENLVASFLDAVEADETLTQLENT